MRPVQRLLRRFCAASLHSDFMQPHESMWMYVNVVVDPSEQIIFTCFWLVFSSWQQEHACISVLDSAEYLWYPKQDGGGTVNHSNVASVCEMPECCWEFRFILTQRKCHRFPSRKWSRPEMCFCSCHGPAPWCSYGRYSCSVEYLESKWRSQGSVLQEIQHFSGKISCAVAFTYSSCSSRQHQSSLFPIEKENRHKCDFFPLSFVGCRTIH